MCQAFYLLDGAFNYYKTQEPTSNKVIVVGSKCRKSIITLCTQGYITRPQFNLDHIYHRTPFHFGHWFRPAVLNTLGWVGTHSLFPRFLVNFLPVALLARPECSPGSTSIYHITRACMYLALPKAVSNTRPSRPSVIEAPSDSREEI